MKLAEHWAITPRMCMEVASHEAVIRQTYVDSVGVDTWSVGLTSATGHNVARYIHNPAPLQHCLNVYVWALDNYADHVRKEFKGYEMTEAQFTAALSFTWNLGPGWLKRATWVKQWKAGDRSSAAVSFMQFRNPPEIIGRREKERDLLFHGKWSNNGTMTEFTKLTKRRTPNWRSAKRIEVAKEIKAALATLDKGGIPQAIPGAQFEPTQPAPTLSTDAVPKPKPMLKSTTNWGAIGQFIGTVTVSLQTLDPLVAAAAIVVSAGFAYWIIRERKLKAENFGI